MDKQEIIREIKKQLPKEILYGTIQGKPFQLFLETKFVDCITGTNVDNMVEFIQEKMVNQVHLASPKDIYMSYIKEQINEDVLNQVTPLTEGKTIAEYLENHYLEEIDGSETINDASLEITLKEIEETILPRLQKEEVKQSKKKYIEDFIKGQKNFVPEIMMHGEFVSTREYLMSKIPFMDDAYHITVGPHQKTIEEVYYTFLNNHEAYLSIVDKMELCADFLNYIEEDVLNTLVEKENCTFKEYIEQILPSYMVSASSVQIEDTVYPIEEFLKEKIEEQKEILAEETKKQEIEQIEKLNRTGENPNLVTEIKLELSGGRLEATGEIPIVASSLLTEEEVSALTHLQFDEHKGVEVSATYLLNDLKEAIYKTQTEHDLRTKEKEVSEIVNGLGTDISLEMQTLIDSIVELITKKRNEMIRIDGNKEDYGEAIIDELKAIQGTIKHADNVDAYSVIREQIDRISDELIDKDIKDQMVIDALYETQKKFHRTHWRYFQTMEKFDKEKNGLICLINDCLSVIRINERKLSFVEEERERQNLMIEVDVKRDAILNSLEEAKKKHLLSENEIEKYIAEMEVKQTIRMVV